jgi:hypothetical protein
MKARSLEVSDIPTLYELHETHFPELVLPDFKKGLCSFVIEDESPVCFGTVQLFAEISIVTDKSKSRRVRREALFRVLDISSYVAKQHGHDKLYAFTNDDNYLKVLTKRGFSLTGKHSVVIGI